ncbi:unnamed protein product [Cutaneotrichosporon oleaginosum]
MPSVPLAWRRSPARPEATANGRSASPHPHPPQAPVQSHGYHANAPAPIYIPPHMPTHLPLVRGHNGTASPGLLTPVASPQLRESPWANCPPAGVSGTHRNMGRRLPIAKRAELIAGVCCGEASGLCIYCRRRVFAPAKGAFPPNAK